MKKGKTENCNKKMSSHPDIYFHSWWGREVDKNNLNTFGNQCSIALRTKIWKLKKKKMRF